MGAARPGITGAATGIVGVTIGGTTAATAGAAPDIIERVRARAVSMTFCISARDERRREIWPSFSFVPFFIIA